MGGGLVEGPRWGGEPPGPSRKAGGSSGHSSQCPQALTPGFLSLRAPYSLGCCRRGHGWGPSYWAHGLASSLPGLQDAPRVASSPPRLGEVGSCLRAHCFSTCGLLAPEVVSFLRLSPGAPPDDLPACLPWSPISCVPDSLQPSGSSREGSLGHFVSSPLSLLSALWKSVRPQDTPPTWMPVPALSAPPLLCVLSRSDPVWPHGL